MRFPQFSIDRQTAVNDTTHWLEKNLATRIGQKPDATNACLMPHFMNCDQSQEGEREFVY